MIKVRENMERIAEVLFLTTHNRMRKTNETHIVLEEVEVIATLPAVKESGSRVIVMIVTGIIIISIIVKGIILHWKVRLIYSDVL